MDRPKPFHLKQTAHKISGRKDSEKQTAEGGKASKKQTAEGGKASKLREYDFCGCCPTGLVVYPESIEDVLDTDCHYVFRENFEMFLRKQRDKNTQTDMQFKLKHEQRMDFVDYLANEKAAKFDIYFLAVAGRKFTKRPDRSSYWPDDLLDGFDEAEALITHLKDLGKDSGLKNIQDLSNDSVKSVKKDLVVSGYRWVVEQLDAALEDFKEFREGLDENEREKWDKSVVQQSVKWSDFEMESFECSDEECERFEEVDALIKGLHKEMDDIIARYNNRNKDIDSLVELIEGKSLGAVHKKKKGNISKSRKKKNPEMKRKEGIKHTENESQQSNLKPCEASLDTKFKLLEVENHVQVEEEVSLNDNSVPVMTKSSNICASEENFNITYNSSPSFLTQMERLMATEEDKADVNKMEEESQLINSAETLVSTDESELSKKEERSIRVKLNISPKYLILEKGQNVKEQKSGDDDLTNKLESTQKELVTNYEISSNVENVEHEIDEVRKDNVVNGQILINEVKKDKKRDKVSKPNCTRDSCQNKGRHKCSRCKAVFYCAQDCLNEDWPHHKMFCDYVFKANQVPGDSTSKKSTENSGDGEEVD